LNIGLSDILNIHSNVNLGNFIKTPSSKHLKHANLLTMLHGLCYLIDGVVVSLGCVVFPVLQFRGVRIYFSSGSSSYSFHNAGI